MPLVLTYDLYNPYFRRYALIRGMLNGTGEPGSDWHMTVANAPKNVKEFLERKVLTRALNGKEYDEQHMLETWHVLVWAIKELQRCWDSWQKDGCPKVEDPTKRMIDNYQGAIYASLRSYLRRESEYEEVLLLGLQLDWGPTDV